MSDAISPPPSIFRRTPARRNTQASPAAYSEQAASTGPETGSIGRASRAVRNVTAQQAATSGLFILTVLFLLSILFPIRFWIFGLLFQPYKLWLMIILIPLGIMFLQGRAGKPMIVDWLMIGSTVWVLISFLKNHGIGGMAVSGGTYIIEFLGAYLLARIAIRSADDFRRMVILLFIVVLVLLPFAALESIMKLPILANLMGQDWMVSETGSRLGMRRAQTVFEHPILFGAFVSTAFGLVWYALIPNAAFVTRMFLVSFIGFATIFSLSTGAFLAVVVQLGLIFWELVTRPHPKRWRIFGWLMLIGYFALDAVVSHSPFHTLVHYAAFNSASSYNRILIFEHGMNNVKANPIFGIGFKDWVRPRWMKASFDNFWLLTAMRHGVPALGMFALGIILIIRKMAQQPLIDPRDRACRAGYLTALGGIIIAGGTVHYWKQLFVFVMFIIGSGVWLFTGGAREPTARTADPPEDPASGHGSRARAAPATRQAADFARSGEKGLPARVGLQR